MMDTDVNKRKQIFYEDVDVGTEIPVLTKKYTLMKMALFASMDGDWCPGHYDHKWAQEKFHQPAPFAYGMHINSHCGQLITDWMGPNGVLNKIRTRTLGVTFPDDVVTFKGKVTGKYVKDNNKVVECEFSAEKQDGSLIAKGSAVVTLPSLSK
ncbi:MaoC family dehydratase [Thermodesulfobacteriota bacterium]